MDLCSTCRHEFKTCQADPVQHEGSTLVCSKHEEPPKPQDNRLNQCLHCGGIADIGIYEAMHPSIGPCFQIEIDCRDCPGKVYGIFSTVQDGIDAWNRSVIKDGALGGDTEAE